MLFIAENYIFIRHYYGGENDKILPRRIAWLFIILCLSHDLLFSSIDSDARALFLRFLREEKSNQLSRMLETEAT